MSETLVTENKAKRARGTGMIYQPSNSKFLWLKYYDNGVCHRESTRTADNQKAEKMLRQRLGQIESGTFTGPQIEKTRISDLGEDYLLDYEVSGKRAYVWAERRWRKYLSPHFGQMRARQLTTNHINEYVRHRQSQGASNASVNRELACLKRAFNLGYRSTPRKVPFVPAFPRLAESAPRTGFVTDAEYEKLTAQNPPLWLRGILALGYNFGFRRGELLGMRVSQIDLLNSTIRLDRGTTKSGEPRLVSFEGLGDVETLLRENVRCKESGSYLFTRDGQRIVEFRADWYALCVEAGLGQLKCLVCSSPVDRKHDCASCKKHWDLHKLKYIGLFFHDLRRSAARNLVRAGVPERVAMAITGHKTRSVFDRYNIVSEDDLRQAAEKIARRKAHYAQVGHTDRHIKEEAVSAISSKPF